jgi:hypothetical protein
MAEDFEACQKAVDEATDPEAQTLEQMLGNLNNECVMAIQQIRLGVSVLNKKTVLQGDMYDKHRRELGEALEVALRKADKASKFLIEGYAHYIHDLQSCSCPACLAANAGMN